MKTTHAGMAVLCSLLLGATACASFSKEVRQDVSQQMATVETPLAGCYEAALNRNRDLAGTMTVKFTAEAKTGQFKDPTVVPPGLGDAELDTCVTGAIASLKLAKPTDTHIAIEYPIRFDPRD